MRIEQLEYIAAVVQHGSLRRASAQLHISLPALIEAVSKLERELGVVLLDRRRGGARISRRGRELLPYIVEVIEVVDRLRTAAGDESAGARVVRVGTVSTGTSMLVVPAVRDVRTTHPATTVEVSNLRQPEIDLGLLEGSLDLGLVNVLDGDDVSPDLVGTPLVRGRPVVVLRTDHPLAAYDEIRLDDLRPEPFVAMRNGYLMHRFLHRLFGAEMPPVSYSADGAELGKVMVAEGLGLTLLPDYSVVGDPLERAGVITFRPLAGDRTAVRLEVRTRPGDRLPAAVRDLVAALVRHAHGYTSTASAPAPVPVLPSA